MRPGGMGTSLSTVMAVTVLPQPDSPTTPTVWPRSTDRSTPSTACSQPSSVLKWVLSPLISSKAINVPRRKRASHDLPWIERVAQSVTDEVDREHRDEDGRAGEQRVVRGDVQVVLAVV